MNHLQFAIKTVNEGKMSKTFKLRDPYARELLTSGKYKQRVVSLKKTYKRKYRTQKDELNELQ
jgi:C4-type Zn-finger protein